MSMSQLRDVADEYPMHRVLAASPHCTVYASTRIASSEPVAVKLINGGGTAALPGGRQRFTRAMGAIQFLRLTSFPELFDFGFAADESAFMVMELVDGVSLATLAGGSPGRIVRALVQVVASLEQLARGEVFHNNLSPDNVLVVAAPDGDEVKIVGFGTAAFLEEGRLGALLGHSPDSDRFTAPERFDADTEPVDSKSDLYSLALVSCELLGAAVTGLGGAAPTVALPAAVRDRLADTAELERLLAVALRADPAARELDHTLLRAALLTVVEGVPEDPAPVSQDADAPLPHDPHAVVEQSDVAATAAAGAVVGAEPTRLAALQAAAAAEDPDDDADELVEAVEVPPPFAPDDAVIDAAASMTDDAGGGAPPGEPPPLPASPPDDGGVVDDDEFDAVSGEFDPNKTDPAIDPSALLPPPVEIEVADEPFGYQLDDDEALAGQGNEATWQLEPADASAVGPRLAPDATVVLAAGPVAPSAGAAPQQRPPGPGRRLPYAVAAVAAVVVLIVFSVVVAALRGTRTVAVDEPAVTVAEVVPTPRPTAAPTPAVASPPRLNLLLEEAHRLMAENDRDGAAAALDGLTDDEIDSFSEAEQAIYSELQSMLEGASKEQFIADLQGGLEIGSIRMLRRAVAGLSGVSNAEIATVPGLRKDLDRAREALQVHAAMWRAHDDGDNPQVLESAAEIIALLPKYSTPYDFRDEAAQALEAQAEGAAAAGHFDVAISVLEPVARFYAARAGLDGKLAGYRRQQQAQAELGPVIDAALAKGAAGQPEAGLKLLAGRAAVPGLEERLSAARTSLEARFAEIDAAVPQLALPADTELVYKKNQDITLPVEVSDDYKVVQVRALVKPEGATEYQSIPVKASAEGHYVVAIPTSLHANGAVSLYLEADDSHGHTGRLGSPSEPVVIDRKGFFKRIFGG